MEEEEELCLEDILALGGTEDDLQLFKGKSFNGKEVDISTDEISSFIQNIGLNINGRKTKAKTTKSSPPPNSVNNAVENVKKKSLSKRDDDDNVNVKKEKKKKKDRESRPTKIKEPKLCPPQDSIISDPIVTSSNTDSMGVVELSAATRELEKKLMKFSIEEHNTVLVSVDNEGPWYNESDSEFGTLPVSQSVIDHLISLAGSVLTCEMKLFRSLQEKKKGKDVQWLKTVLSSGTLSDKMAAMTLLIQESPFHSLSNIDAFVSLSKKRSKRENLIAIDHFKDLLVSDILPENRKLKYLKQRPLETLLIAKSHGSMTCDVKKLFMWYFEDRLKNKYNDFVNLLKELLHDPIAEIREKITGVVFDLLYNRSEQEQLLLKLLVNKLGDPSRKLASKCIMFLLKLLNHHVNMKLIVVREIEALLYRPNIPLKTQYYTICFLNQIIIGPTDQLLPQKLVSLYFSFFKIYVDSNEFDAKILSALLTGVNRALPFVKADIPLIEDHLTSLFKIVHVGPLATGIQSLTLLHQVMESRSAVSSRYYQSLYRKLCDPQLAKRTGQQAMFLNLLFKSLRSDPELNRNKAFLKRILQSCDHHMPHLVCGCLIVLSEILKIKPILWSYILQPEGTDKEEVFKDVPEDKEEMEKREEGNEEENDDVQEMNHQDSQNNYLLTKRDPLYSKAELSTPWEFSRFTHHFHPSVQVFANSLVSGDPITYDGNPLEDFTSLKFLDHFIHKNPKQKSSDHGGSLMQPTGGLVKGVSYTLPASVNDLAKMEEKDVRTDLQFIHKFLRRDVELHKIDTKKSTSRRKRKRRKGEEHDHLPSDEGENSENKNDFAGELTKRAQELKVMNKEKKKKAKRDDSSQDEEESVSGGDYDDMDSEGDFSWDDDDDDSLDNEENAYSSDNDNVNKKGKKKRNDDEMDENEMERMLLANLSSSDDEEEEEDMRPNKKRKRKEDDTYEGQNKQSKRSNSSSVFASAEEFAHLLDGGKGSNIKEKGWEERRSSNGWRGGRSGTRESFGRERGAHRGSFERRGTRGLGRGSRGMSRGSFERGGARGRSNSRGSFERGGTRGRVGAHRSSRGRGAYRGSFERGSSRGRRSFEGGRGGSHGRGASRGSFERGRARGRGSFGGGRGSSRGRGASQGSFESGRARGRGSFGGGRGSSRGRGASRGSFESGRARGRGSFGGGRGSSRGRGASRGSFESGRARGRGSFGGGRGGSRGRGSGEKRGTRGRGGARGRSFRKH